MKKLLQITLAVASCVALAPQLARADCPGSSAFFQTTIVTYFQLRDQSPLLDDTRCSIVNVNGSPVCRIRMKGVLHSPVSVVGPDQPPPTFPVIIFNHGSEYSFPAATKGCAVANYFVPKGYIVFVPFRRGHGELDNSTPDPDDLDLNKASTGTYVENQLAIFAANPQSISTACNDNLPANPSPEEMNLAHTCYKAELLRQQADQEVADAFNYLHIRADVKDDAIAIGGSSYGGRVTVFANRNNLGHKAAVVISPAAQAWGSAAQPSFIQIALVNAATQAKSPAFYLQAKWDFDTRPTIDLAVAHYNGSPDLLHAKRFMAAIYEYPKPPDLNPDPNIEELDFDSVHIGFVTDPEHYWGVAVLDFLKRNGVE